MPTYEYLCTEPTCQHVWEADQSIKDEPLKGCPKCESAISAKRQISSTSFVLQGTGWFKDGY